MKIKTFEVWLLGNGGVEPLLITAKRAIVTESGRLKFLSGGFFETEIAAFNCGQWQCFFARRDIYNYGESTGRINYVKPTKPWPRK